MLTGLFLIMMASAGLLAGFSATAAADNIDDAMTLFVKGSYADKKVAIETLVASGNERAEAILSALLGSDLYFSKDHKKVVIGKRTGRVYEIQVARTGEILEPVKKRRLKKIGINNSLRSTLKTALAQLRLSDPDPDVRRAAIEKMYSRLTPENETVFSQLLTREKNRSVRKTLETALALIAIRQGTNTPADETAIAIRSLSGNLHPAVRNTLKRLIAGDADPAVAGAARSVLQGIERRIAIFGFLETVFFGLSLGSVLVLASIGLAITFGVIGVINMAHGELIMLGAYTTYVLQQMMPNAIGWSLVLAVPVAFVVTGAAGIAIERTVIRFLYGRPLETLLATFGLSLILQQAVRTIFSPLNRSVSTPQWMSGAIQFNAVLSLTTNRVVIFLFSLLVFGGLALLLKKSAIGLQVRAVSQNRAMARAMGVRAARVDALTFGLGSGIAGIAGVALSQLTNVGPNLGQAYIVDSFMVVVFGGVGNLWGTLLGGLTLGVTNKFLEPWTGAVLAKILILVFIILFIQKRPQGLFPQKGRAAG
jgi:urea transport system permease protein